MLMEHSKGSPSEASNRQPTLAHFHDDPGIEVYKNADPGWKDYGTLYTPNGRRKLLYWTLLMSSHQEESGGISIQWRESQARPTTSKDAF